ncbi:transmembrane protein [Mycobacterium bohemicum DSM 44277]|uniref:Transmembrane protein n=1 Tax=Mycobacterium bohemicum DSM 44277 TaxID=1236609 RepID=A0A0U0W3A3_MYCBE|nr:transmembrane protein [Mycobacterium bohemicum DSM 44277]
MVQHNTAPSLTLTLPRPTEVAGLRVLAGRSPLPARPTMVAVNLGDGPQVRELGGDQPQTLSLRPRVTDTVTISLLDWQDIIDRNALGFDQLKPPGLAEVAVLGSDGNAIAPADGPRNRARRVSVGCDDGPVIAIAGRFVHTRIDTTVGALLDGDPVPALPCEGGPIALPPGHQELLISPGAQFVVDGAELTASADSPSAATVPAPVLAWGEGRRQVRAPASARPRLLVIPESINPGWVARTGTGARLTPVAVNGWQQGWVVPAGDAGTITLTFASNGLYRAGLAVGLALLPLLAALAFWRTRRRGDDEEPPARPRVSGIWAAIAVLGAGGVVAGAAGVVVTGAALGLRYALRGRYRTTVALSAGGLILAGAVLSRHPWRSVDGYAGHWAIVQLLALISLAALAASVVTVARRRD